MPVCSNQIEGGDTTLNDCVSTYKVSVHVLHSAPHVHRHAVEHAEGVPHIHVL